jgi:amidase
MTSDICFMEAGEIAARIRRRELSASEVLEAHLAQIERVNPAVNAIVTLVADRARARAEMLDRAEALGPLHGVPVLHKDLTDTAGVRTTYGSPLFRDHIPAVDAILVERQRNAGAIMLGKSNTPEFGAGSQTFNSVFGSTKNPWDLTKTCGGSSGGAAVALACGMTALADGSDLGGSLRNPASFCNVVGLRPAGGRVAAWPAISGWYSMSVEGPMARTVSDVALLLSVIAGADDRAPISIREDPSIFSRPLDRDLRGVRIAWHKGLGLPFESEVTAVVDAHRGLFESLGCVVTEDEPNLDGAEEAFLAYRGWIHEMRLGDTWRRDPTSVKPTLAGDIERGAKLSAGALGRAEILRTSVYHRMRQFFERHDFFVMPVCQVVPFDIDRQFISRINAIDLPSYTDWMKSCYLISVPGNPAISVPAGFTPSGLPVGLQIVSRHADERGLLEIAYAFEQATGFSKLRPPVARAASRPQAAS